MRRKYFLPILCVLLSSCSIVRYNEQEFGTTTHSEEMNTRFKSKKDVFNEFGVADKKDVLYSTEVWTYNLNAVSHTNSQTNGTTVYKKRSAMSAPGVVGKSKTNLTTSGSTNTIQNYVTFWFEGDSIVKWESVGLDIGKPYPNPNYDPVKAVRYQRYNLLANLGISGLLFFVLSAGI